MPMPWLTVPHSKRIPKRCKSAPCLPKTPRRLPPCSRPIIPNLYHFTETYDNHKKSWCICDVDSCLDKFEWSGREVTYLSSAVRFSPFAFFINWAIRFRHCAIWSFILVTMKGLHTPKQNKDYILKEEDEYCCYVLNFQYTVLAILYQFEIK